MSLGTADNGAGIITEPHDIFVSTRIVLWLSLVTGLVIGLSKPQVHDDNAYLTYLLQY